MSRLAKGVQIQTRGNNLLYQRVARCRTDDSDRRIKIRAEPARRRSCRGCTPPSALRELNNTNRSTQRPGISYTPYSVYTTGEKASRRGLEFRLGLAVGDLIK
jgi:hypothetical protein